MASDETGLERSDEDIERLIEQLWLAERPAPVLPNWVPPALALLPFVLISVTILNGMIGLIAILTPVLAASSWGGAADWIYSAYSFICPQRPDHTFFISNHPMAFEQRDLAMHLAFAGSGLLYLRLQILRRPLSTIWLAVGLLPMLIDVFISTVAWLPATAVSRSWTGALASFAIVWWSYPRFDEMLTRVQNHVENLRTNAAAMQPNADRFVEAIKGDGNPSGERS